MEKKNHKTFTFPFIKNQFFLQNRAKTCRNVCVRVFQTYTNFGSPRVIFKPIRLEDNEPGLSKPYTHPIIPRRFEGTQLPSVNKALPVYSSLHLRQELNLHLWAFAMRRAYTHCASPASSYSSQQLSDFFRCCTTQICFNRL